MNKRIKQNRNSSPRVTVIMPCYDSQRYLKEAIDSILNQTYANFELIIVDDGSKDKTMEIVEEYQERDVRIKSVKNKGKKGQAGAMNTGFDLSKGSKYIARMDSDDISSPKRLEIQVSFLERNTKYGLCSVNMQAIGELEIPLLFKDEGVPLEWLFFWKNPMAGPATMYRADMIRKNKLYFRESKVASDYDFFSRALLHTRPKMLYEEALYKYRIHAESVFQKNKNQALSNSIKFNENFVKALIKTNVPDFHMRLTDFNLERNKDIDFSIYEIVEWMNNLLESSKKQWEWTEEEYNKARIHSDNFIKKIIGSVSARECEEVLSARDIRVEELSKEVINKDKIIKVLNEEMFSKDLEIKDLERVKFLYENSRSWKLTKPFRTAIILLKKIKNGF